MKYFPPRFLTKPKTSVTFRALAGIFLIFTPAQLEAQGTPIISEFLASNDESLTVENGESPDWIEIHNPGPASVDLAGWHLTDDELTPDRWTFPAGTIIAPDAYLLVFATGADLHDPSADLHTNFKLTQNGEYLALLNPAGETQQEFAPTYPEQFTNVSYGFPQGQNEPAYFTVPTPGEANNQSVQGFAKDTKFSVKRGFFEAVFQVAVTSSTPGSSIYYTTDGSDPDLSSTRADAADDLTPPTLTLDITTTTVLRAYAAKPGFVPSNIDTQSYLFTAQVISHPEMATRITEDSVWGPMLKDALLEIPSISLITQEAIPDNEPSIANPREIPVSIEMIFPDGREGFQLNAGVERFGGQYSIFDKQALRVSFKEIYGPKRLKFDLFSDTPYGGDSAVDSFDQIVLRNGSHDALFFEGYPRPRNGALVRNRYYFDRQLEMGHPSLRGKFVHVYLNGVYNGQYHLMERPNADHMATHYGGEEEDYDVMKGRSGISAAQGYQTTWNTMVASSGNFDAIGEYLDFDNYIDYMLLNFYGGNDHDWYPQHNWVAARKREDGSKFQFFMWDNDFLNRRLPSANTIDNGGPGNIFGTLKNNAEFKMRMADRAQLHFFNGGMLTKERVEADFNELGARLARTVIPETARWGSSNSTFYTPTTFENAIAWLATGFSATRSETVIQQMRNANVFPDINAPSFSQNGGEVPAGYSLKILHQDGDLYYTTDGSDPRLRGEAINPSATIVNAFTSAIEAGSDWKFDDSGRDYGSSWYGTGFEDGSWTAAPAPLGFGGINNTTVATTVNQARPRKVTVYFRKSFQISEAASISEGLVGIHADDGAIIYLNGTEIIRENMPEGIITPDTLATASGNEGVFDPFTVDGSLFVEGENVICVEIHNKTAGSSDMVFDLELGYQSFATISVEATSQIRARIYDGTEWSALNEAIFITDQPASAANLVISEIHYNPSAEQDGDSEFIEIMNISAQSINLAGVSFTEGIAFSFDDQASLAPGERLVLISDQIAFEAAFGNTLAVGGSYTSRLANNGERVTLSAADGSIIQTSAIMTGSHGLRLPMELATVSS